MVLDSTDFRSEICRFFGIANVAEAHEIIVAGAKKGVERLLKKGLNSKALIQLGYDASGMEKLGYKRPALERLGYYEPRPEKEEPSVEQKRADELDAKQLISSGYRAIKLKEKGVTVHHCKKAGCSAGELTGLGFSLTDLAAVCGCAELRMAGFRANELRGFFTGHELISSGFDARELRIAGFTIRELLNFGFNQRNIITAGYSVHELVQEGLSKRTKLAVKKR